MTDEIMKKLNEAQYKKLKEMETFLLEFADDIRLHRGACSVCKVAKSLGFSPNCPIVKCCPIHEQCSEYVKVISDLRMRTELASIKLLGMASKVEAQMRKANDFTTKAKSENENEEVE